MIGGKYKENGKPMHFLMKLVHSNPKTIGKANFRTDWDITFTSRKQMLDHAMKYMRANPNGEN